MALRWKKNPRPSGLYGVVAGPQGSTLRDGEIKFASTGFISKRHGHKHEGWYWVAGWGSNCPHKNTCNDPVSDEATAKADAMAYVREYLKATHTAAQAATDNKQD